MAFRLDDNLGYWLFYTQRILSYAFADVLRQNCLKHNWSYTVTPPQWGVLSLLLEHDGMTIGAISMRRGLDPPTVTGIVNRLEHNGLLERRHDREDRRVVKVYLTNEGREVTESLFESAQTMNAVLTRTFSQEEQQQLLRQLQQIIVNIAAVGPGMGDRFGLLSRDALDNQNDHENWNEQNNRNEHENQHERLS